MGEIIHITPNQAWQKMQQGGVLVDVRNQSDFVAQHVPQAFWLNDQTYTEFYRLCSFEQPIIIICYHGRYSLKVAHFLIEQGFHKVYNITGGFQAWLDSHLPVEKLT